MTENIENHTPESCGNVVSICHKSADCVPDSVAREIPLNAGYVALVDDVDFDRVSQFKWFVEHKRGKAYARSKLGGTQPRMYLHHFILGTTELTDHRDGNGLNNTRLNLRPATFSQNGSNRRKSDSARMRSRFKGVELHGARWRTRIKLGGKRIEIGRYDSEEEAARAYDAAALKHHGEFARLNFPSAVGQ